MNQDMMHQPPSGPGSDDLPPPWYVPLTILSNSYADQSRIKQFNDEYQTWFYVNPTTNPPTTSWTHPSLAPGQAAPEQVHAIQSAIGSNNGDAHGGSAADFMSSAPAQSYDQGQGQYPTTAQPGQAQVGGTDGERGMGTNVAMSMLQSQMGGGKHNNNGYGGGGGVS